MTKVTGPCIAVLVFRQSASLAPRIRWPPPITARPVMSLQPGNYSAIPPVDEGRRRRAIKARHQWTSHSIWLELPAVKEAIELFSSPSAGDQINISWLGGPVCGRRLGGGAGLRHGGDGCLPLIVLHVWTRDRHPITLGAGGRAGHERNTKHSALCSTCAGSQCVQCFASHAYVSVIILKMGTVTSSQPLLILEL